MMAVAIGQTVPDCTMQVTGDTNPLMLSALRGSKLVIYFYPKDNTPGCTQESQDFRDAYAAFQANNTLILGVSRDSLKSHEKFQARQSLPFNLISDTDESLCQLFGVIQAKNSYGRVVRGIERSTFLLDEQGVLRKEWRKVKVAGHISAILAAITQLN